MNRSTQTENAKKQLGIVSSNIKKEEQQAIIANWDTDIVQTVCDKYNWQGKKNTVFFERYNIMTAEWDILHGKSQVRLEIFYASDYDAAIDFMSYQASLTTMMEIPYTRSSRVIGSCTLIPRRGQNDKTFWTYKNICAVLTLNDGDADLLEMAEYFQMAFEPFIRPWSELDAITILDAESLKKELAINETLSIKIELPSATTPNIIDAFTLNSNAQIASVSSSGVRVVGSSKGDATIAIVIGNPVTLQSKATLIDLKIMR